MCLYSNFKLTNTKLEKMFNIIVQRKVLIFLYLISLFSYSHMTKENKIEWN